MNTNFPTFPEGFDPETYRRDVELFTQQADKMTESVKRLSKSSTDVIKAFQTVYSALKYKREFGALSDGEYFDELAKARDRYFSKGSQEWYKYTQEIYNGKMEMLSKYRDSVLEHLEEMSKEYLDELSVLAEAREEFTKKLDSAFGDEKGFKTVKTTIENFYPDGSAWVFYDHYLSDFDKEIEKLKEFDETLKALKERGQSLSPENFRAFFEELRTLSVEDANILANLLLESNDKDFLHYLEGYHAKKELTKSISVNLYADDFESMMLEIEAALENGFAEIPPEFFTYGEMTAENFKEGFLREIKTIFWDIETLLEENWFNFAPTLGAPKEEYQTFAPSYHLYGTTGSALEQILTAKSQAVLDKLRLGAES